MSTRHVSAGNMRNLQDIAIAAMQKRADLSSKDRLRLHPGKGHTVLDFGLKRLADRANAMGVSPTAVSDIEAKAAAQYERGQALCESPIERAMLAALLTGMWPGFETIPPVVHDGRNKDEMLPPGDVIIVPQMAFLRYRLDFGVVVEIAGVRRIVCVECDGAEFHTEYRREVLRSGYLQSWDIPVFKFTGSELHEDAIASADAVISAISRWRADQ